VFYDGGLDQKLARLCFAKRDDTLARALERLASL
jgi:methionine aminotransferase